MFLRFLLQVTMEKVHTVIDKVKKNWTGQLGEFKKKSTVVIE